MPEEVANQGTLQTSFKHEFGKKSHTNETVQAVEVARVMVVRTSGRFCSNGSSRGVPETRTPIAIPHDSMRRGRLCPPHENFGEYPHENAPSTLKTTGW